MSVNSVSTGILPFYSPLSGNSSQTAKYAPLAKELPEQTSLNADGSQVTAAEVDGVTQDVSDPTLNGDSADASQFQSTLEQTLQQGAATAESTARGASETSSGQLSPGIASYQRISQYGNNEPSTSALLRRWNSIMQSGKDADGAAADFAKLLSQNEAPGLESGILDLTA